MNTESNTPQSSADRELRRRLFSSLNHNCNHDKGDQFFMGEFDRGYRGYVDVNWNTRQVTISQPYSQSEVITIEELDAQFEAVINQLREDQDNMDIGGLF